MDIEKLPAYPSTVFFPVWQGGAEWYIFRQSTAQLPVLINLFDIAQDQVLRILPVMAPL